MPQLLIRNVDPALKRWIEESSYDLRVAQWQFVVSQLRQVQRQRTGPTLFDMEKKPGPSLPQQGLPVRFVDLFAGIGGMRIGLERNGGKCVFTSEWDKNAQRTYRAWFGDLPHGDIREIASDSIPDHDILAAGFPCQPFSIAGVSKKKSLGREHGFRDVTQGTLFFHLAKIIEAKRPPVLLLENVKNLKSHDRGQTWNVIRGTLEDLGYTVHHKVIDAAGWVPQHRERVFIIGFDSAVFGPDLPFEFPSPPSAPSPRFRDILDPHPPEKYTLTDHLWGYLQRYAAKHQAKGNGFGFGMTEDAPKAAWLMHPALHCTQCDRVGCS